MAYSALTFTASEVPTLTKWNQLWANDASFNDGTGIGNNAITAAKINAAAVTAAKIDFTTVFLGLARLSASRTFSTVAVYITDLSVSVTIPTGVTKVRVTAKGYAVTCAGGGYGEIYIYRGASIGALTTKIASHQIANTSAAPGETVIAIDDVTPGSTVVYTVAALATAGGGNWYSDGLTPNSSFISVEACR